MSGVTRENLDDVFRYHAPAGAQPEQYDLVRAAGMTLALRILENTPACGDQQAAIRKVREAVMTANAAIAFQGAYDGQGIVGGQP